MFNKTTSVSNQLGLQLLQLKKKVNEGEHENKTTSSTGHFIKKEKEKKIVYFKASLHLFCGSQSLRCAIT